jgi:hypothetical protein
MFHCYNEARESRQPRRFNEVINNQSILQIWLQPLQLGDFLNHHWAKIPYRAEANASRLEFTENLLPSLDVSVLLESSREPIRVWYRDGEKPVYSFQLGKSEALHAYRAGLTLYFHLNDSIAGQVINELGSDLRRPPFLFNVSIFASRGGAQTMPHVDNHENFTVQLQGNKRWKISAGEECPEVVKLKGESKEFAHTLYSTLKPPDWNQMESFEMTPGTFLYCPANYWHTVEAMTDSLSINISLSNAYTWADALLPAIRALLMRQAEWQSPDVALWATGDQQKDAQDQMRKLLGRLSQDLQDPNIDDVLEAWISADERSMSQIEPVTFIRNPLVSCDIVFAEPDHEFRFRIESTVRPRKKDFLTMDWKYYIPFLRLVSDRSVHHAEDFEDVSELVSQLLHYGVLRPI